jgi:hypothetical protein
MPHEKRKPAAGKATGFLNIEWLGSATERQEIRPAPLTWQAAYVATRYNVSPSIARLIVELAEIGGRLA